MIDERLYKQYGVEREEVKCIVIHNTGTDKSLKEILDFLENGKTSKGCHFLVDDKECVQVMPLNYSVWNTGKGNDYAFHYGIAIEICSNIDKDKYLKGQDRAIKLIKELMKEYRLTTKDIYFHCDFDRKYCPKDILDIYGNKQNFIRKELL